MRMGCLGMLREKKRSPAGRGWRGEYLGITLKCPGQEGLDPGVGGMSGRAYKAAEHCKPLPHPTRPQAQIPGFIS